eukprot:4547745-Lingulodinium_polyedra.AAC.1
MAEPTKKGGGGFRCIALEIEIRPASNWSADEPTLAAYGFGGGAPEYRVLASRDTQDEVQEWIMKIQSLAWAEQGRQEWRTHLLAPGPGLGWDPGLCTPCVATTHRLRQLRLARRLVAKRARLTSGDPSTGKMLW